MAAAAIVLNRQSSDDEKVSVADDLICVYSYRNTVVVVVDF